MRVFIAGIMQAERQDDQIESQDYRLRITQALQSTIPDVEITDPFALNPNSVNYGEEKARHTFLTMTRMASQVDLLIAYLPKISMGTAMEMWEAYRAGVPIIAVTPYIHHWAIRHTANEILPDLDSLIAGIENGRFAHITQKRPVDSLPEGH
ncbi:MAG: hypothetical protein GY803_13055 [Chloroflexi bacterium]|nr:hypothetical protein [Chloroflexota bacterium]